MYPHRIRLRGPWEWEPIGSAGSLPAPRRVRMPCRWSELGLTGFPGRVRFRRRFGYPGRIDATERVWLTLAGIEGSVEIRLNDHGLGRHEGGPVEFDITALLQPRNQLEIVVEVGAADGGLGSEVALEVRRTAFLRAVRLRCEPEGGLRIEGEVAGFSERPLDLYLLVDGGSAGYQAIQAGRPFFFVVEKPPSSPAVRVELVDAATLWYAVELPG